jgi:hypothetical protein
MRQVALYSLRRRSMKAGVDLIGRLYCYQVRAKR